MKRKSANKKKLGMYHTVNDKHFPNITKFLIQYIFFCFFALMHLEV